MFFLGLLHRYSLIFPELLYAKVYLVIRNNLRGNTL
jgi:hypothetical protein